jgi:hypothetical protein
MQALQVSAQIAAAFLTGGGSAAATTTGDATQLGDIADTGMYVAARGGIVNPTLSRYAMGGIEPSFVPPLKHFAMGGISDSPAIFGEGPMPEAAVPLPDGRTIPVSLGRTPQVPQAKSGGDTYHVNVNVHGVTNTDSFRRTSGQIAGSTREMMQRIQRRN